MRVRCFPALILSALGLCGTVQILAFQSPLPNRIPEPPPYNTGEASFYPPPFESDWDGVDNPGSCDGCHNRIFSEWNGSMMSNSWRDPGWRGAFLLVSRLTAKDGNCDIPTPPDGSPRAMLNPFADAGCSSTFNIGTTTHTTSGSGSLLDGFCSRCHMTANYADNIPLAGVGPDSPSGLEHGDLDPNFDPTSDNGTGAAFATLLSQIRNTNSGKRGVFCEICHTAAETRYTPYHNYQKSGTEYYPALGSGSRDGLLPPGQQDMLGESDPASPNLGYGVGAGSFRLSPHAIGFPERFGPLSANDFSGTTDPYVSEVFGINFFYQQGDFSGKHDGYYQTTFERSEFCSACHDVTNSLTLKNQEGHWVGGFPIERTYTEWRNSRYADRPDNPNFDPASKRDCQTCHMQQDFGRPGTAQTLYPGGQPAAPLSSSTCKSGPVRPVFYSHHFIGGNAYIPGLIGEAIDGQGNPQPYPHLSVYSYSSADSGSVYYNAVWDNPASSPATHHARLAWDRLRNVLDLQLSGPASVSAGNNAPVTITVSNTGSGHNFPTGFPEGRNAWVSIRAFDLATGDELQIQDSFWGRTSPGVGYLTQADVLDPNYPPGCNWVIPAGSADPYAAQFKAVASLGDGCPTLELPYATPLNLVTNANGLPIDSGGTVIDRANPLGLPRFNDVDGDGDLYDDAFLVDSRLRPLPHSDASLTLGRYSVVVPAGTTGPVAVTAAVYYQSFEAVVAKKFLGNMADLDTDFQLEPCVLGGLCDGRTSTSEPAVVEGAPPVPMEVRSWVINIAGATDATPPGAETYPAAGAVDTYLDTVPKVFFSEPVTGVDETTFTLVDGGGVSVPASVSQISDGVWALFPDSVFLEGQTTYTARVAAPVCDFNGNCTAQDVVWSFTTARTAADAVGDTTVPLGFGGGTPPAAGPQVTNIDPPDGETNVDVNRNVVATFSEPVINVTNATFLLNVDGGGNCATLGASVAGTLLSNPAGDVWTFDPDNPLQNNRTRYCVTINTGVTNLAGVPLNDGTSDFTSSFVTRKN